MTIIQLLDAPVLWLTAVAVILSVALAVVCWDEL